MVAFLMVILFIMLFAKVPIFVALAFSSLLTLMISGDLSVNIAAQRMFAGMDKFSLMAMPFFIFAADIMRRGGIAKRLLDFTLSIVGFMRGGLALTTQLACMLFGALSGSSPATVAAMGGLMYPEMIAKGYKRAFSIGLITVSGAVALLIPPSVTLIVYGTVTGVSVGALFMGGIMPGIVFGAVILAYSYYVARKENRPPDANFSFREVLRTTKEAAWALGVPIIILGGIYFGVFTPTESAGVSAVYAAFVGMFIYKEFTWKSLMETALNSTITLVGVMIIVAGASVFGWVLTVYQAPQLLANFLMGPNTNQITFWIGVNILFLLAGMFMDGVAATTILAPLVYPLAMNLGINPVHLGVTLTANTAIGQYTPPFGLNLFVATGITKEPMLDIIRAVIPFIFLTLIALLIITYWPDLTLLIPRLTYPESVGL
ncbi:MAG TPA: TRAP transporter large permease [Firmicutes bacterium]|nr:TRAP transporter large permease [Bacillota bacterium]